MDEGPDQPLTVSELAREAGVTARALRHYDHVGLLRPARVDPANGYRLYAREQVADVRLVAMLRAYDVPLPEVARCLAGAPAERTGTVEAVLRTQRSRLDARRTRLSRQIHRLEHPGEHPGEDPDEPLTGPTVPLHAAPARAEGDVVLDERDERALGIALFNATWAAMEVEDRGIEDDDRLVHLAHASAHHWAQVGTAANRARSEWLCSRVHAVLGRAEPARHHAERVRDICLEAGIGDWDLAFAHEALARAAAVGGDLAGARRHRDDALAAAADIVDPGDRDLLLEDLRSIPGLPQDGTPHGKTPQGETPQG